MATATSECRGRNEVHPEFALDENIAARAKALREGRKLPPLAEHNTTAAAVAEHRNSRPPREFVSRADARELSPDDIANVRPLKVEESREFDRFAVDIIAAEREVWDWPEDDERWTLTPHQVAKLNRRKRAAK